MFRKIFLFLILFLLITSTCAAIPLPNGCGDFIFSATNNPGKPIRIWYYEPKSLKKKDARIVFVMHGSGRDGKKYRDQWIKYADKGNFLVLAPEFSKDYYPDMRAYDQGNIVSISGKYQDRSQWIWSSIERIFDYVKDRYSVKAEKYYIYGHSSGGQFVHRMIIFEPRARVKMAVAANAGFYTLPDFNIDYPYGLAKTWPEREAIAGSFAQRLIIMVGKQDTDPNQKFLDAWPKARTQGKNRLERGRNFFKQSRRAARVLKANFRWEFKEIVGAGHSNSKMSRVAADLILRDLTKSH